jgi:phosphoribosylanthranilate isomerase
MMVKICGVTNLDDALAAAEGGASALGFNFYPQSPRYIHPSHAAEITAALPAGIWKVGVFVNERPTSIMEIAELARLDIAQLHGDEMESAYPTGIRIWKAIRVDDTFRLADLERHPVDAILLDGPAGLAYGGAGKGFDWSLAAGSRKSIILAGGLDAANVRAAIAAAHPWGVDVCSRIESSPGRKDHVKMAQFLKEASR